METYIHSLCYAAMCYAKSHSHNNNKMSHEVRTRRKVPAVPELSSRFRDFFNENILTCYAIKLCHIHYMLFCAIFLTSALCFAENKNIN
jgi:hypothetical protein